MLTAVKFASQHAPRANPGPLAVEANEEEEEGGGIVENDEAADRADEKGGDEGDRDDGVEDGDVPPGIGVTDREGEGGEESEEEEESENEGIGENDFVLIGTKADEGDAHLLVEWVYEPEDERGPPNLYPHHEVPLGEFPLCLEWLDFCPGASGHHVGAVGTGGGDVELFDMDVTDAVEPCAILAGAHQGGTMAISWNVNRRHVLATAGADSRARLWDISKLAPDREILCHEGKVQAATWCPSEPSVLLTAGFDKQAAVTDARDPSSLSLRFPGLPADAEDAEWDEADMRRFFCSCEDGSVLAYDARAPGPEPLWSMSAHEKACSAIASPPSAPGLLVTSSMDGGVFAFDCRGADGPMLVSKLPANAGEIFSLNVAARSGLGSALMCAGGAGGEPFVIDLSAFQALVEAFPSLR